MKRSWIALAAILCSCGKYDDFTLEKLPKDEVAYRNVWKVNPNPILGRGAAGQWDSVDVLNPSIVRTARDPSHLLNLYSGFDGRTWHTGLATWGDEHRWVKRGKVLSPDPSSWEGSYIAANGSALEHERRFYLWYQAGGAIPSIGFAQSPDGFSWEKDPKPVMEPGPRGSWDERGVADPYVIRQGGFFFLFYLGQDRARQQRIGVARSVDGRIWSKLRTNPILDLGEPGSFDETGLGEPAVWRSNGSYWMLYTARDRHENRRLGLARSSDGARWQRVSSTAALAGGEAWNSKVVCDPHVEVRDGKIRVWFGGGDRAEPAENLNGQIGEAELQLVPATLSK